MRSGRSAAVEPASVPAAAVPAAAVAAATVAAAVPVPAPESAVPVAAPEEERVPGLVLGVGAGVGVRGAVRDGGDDADEQEQRDELEYKRQSSDRIYMNNVSYIYIILESHTKQNAVEQQN